jgi:alpha-glucosidase
MTATSSSSAATAAISGSSATSTTSYYRTTPTPGVRNINYPPYVINNINGDLAAHAVSPNATHSDDVLEYDVHNLFGYKYLASTTIALPD